MLFADVHLAARIEQADCGLLRDCAAAVANRRDVGAMIRPIAGGVAVFADVGSPLNKVAGIGFCGPIDPAELAEVERAFVGVGSPIQIELSCLAEAGIAAMLTGRGYRLVGFENVLGQRLPAALPPAAAHGVEVNASGAEEIETWLEVVSTGFANPDSQGVASHESFPREAVEAVMRDMAGAPGMVRYLARRDGVAVGGASMRVDGGICQLCGASTLPEHRRRGVQSAMLLRRLADAERAGGELAVVTTLPGSKSQQNVQRLGFALLYTRAVLVLEP